VKSQPITAESGKKLRYRGLPGLFTFVFFNVKKQAPIFKVDPKPDNMTKKEEAYYYAKERGLWESGIDFSGYGQGIPGTLYHYLKEQKLKHRITLKGHTPIESPICREADWMIFHEVEERMRRKRMLGMIKARNIGLSTIGGSLVNYHMIVYPGSTSFITSKSQNTIGALFRDKIMVPFESYDDAIRPDIIQKSETMDKNYLKVGVHYVDGLGRKVYDESVCECNETSERPASPENFSGRGANFGFYDEFPLHKRRNALIRSSIECYRDPRTREIGGFLFWGGTVEYKQDGTGIGEADLAELEHLVDNADMYDMDVIFIPFWMSMYDPETGRVDRAAAERWWEAEYKKVAKDEDAKKGFMRNNARTKDDIFETITSNRWEDNVAVLIKLQKEDVIKAGTKLQTCNLVEISGRYEFTAGDTTHILEHPKPGVEYAITVDGVQTSGITSATPERLRSKIAAVVHKLIDPATHPYMPVLLFAEHPKSLEGSVEKILDIIRYYDKYDGVTKINAEINVGFGEFFGTILKNQGYSRKIARKKDFSQDGFRDTKKWFYYRDIKVLERQMAAANKFLKRYISSIQILPLLEAMMKQASKNSDELDAWLGIFETFPDIGMDVKKKARTTPQRYTSTFIFEDGRLVLKAIPAQYANT